MGGSTARGSETTAETDDITAKLGGGTDLWHPGHASYKQHLIDVRGGHAGVLHTVPAGFLGAVQQVTH